MTSTPSSDPLVEALTQLRLYGCVARIEEIRGEPWLERLMTLEREERTRRSLVHRTHLAGVGPYKSLCDFDWAWPKCIDRVQVAGNWQMVLVRVLRALMEANRTPASSAAG